MKRKSLKLNALLNSIRGILNILFPIITFPYVSRVLSVSGIGIYNFSSSFVSYFLLIAALGVNSYAIREGSKIRDSTDEISRFASEIYTINMFSTVISYVLLFLCLFIFGQQLRSYIICILIFSLQIVFTTMGTEWIYQIYEDYIYITIRSIVFQIVSIILLFIFVRNSHEYLNYAIITVFSVIGSNVLNFIHAREYCNIHLVWNFKWQKHLLPIFTLFFASIANMVYLNSDVTLLGLMQNNYIVGIYSVSSKIYQIVKTLIISALIVTVPRLAMLFGKKRLKEYSSILSRLTNILVILTLPASVGLFMLAKEVILLISGAHFTRAIYSLRILCFAYVFALLAWILTDCILIPAKREKFVLISMSVSAILNILLNILLIPIFAENAAAFSTVIAEFSIFVINLYYTRDIIRKVFTINDFLKNLFSSIAGCIGIIVICLICDFSYKSLLLKSVCSVFLSAIIYFAILVLLRNNLIFSLIEKIR